MFEDFSTCETKYSGRRKTFAFRFAMIRNLDPSARSGCPKVLITTDKDHIIATVKRDSETQRMSLNQIRNEANVTHVSSQTIFNTLHERGIVAYRETLKLPLKEEHMRQRLQFCKDHVDWKADQEWANRAFTDEMGMKIGYKYGVTTVWREGTDFEKWDNTFVGRKQRQGSSVMC